MSLRGFRFEVFGRVQGVYFRAHAREAAEKLGVVGWIRNTKQGTVEGEAQGTKESMANLDVGGYRTFNGKFQVRQGKLYRSGNLVNASTSTLRSIAAAPISIGSIIDLRMPDEHRERGFGSLLDVFEVRINSLEPEDEMLDGSRIGIWNGRMRLDNSESEGSSIYRDHGALYLCPLISKSSIAWSLLRRLSFLEALNLLFSAIFCLRNRIHAIFGSKLWHGGIFGLYRLILRTGGARICKVLKKITSKIHREPESALLVNCAWGKDRTGIIIALVLLSIGVSEDDVINDYAMTEKLVSPSQLREQIPESFEMASFRDSEHREAVLLELLTSPGSVMRNLLDYINAEFGSAFGYLDHIGFDSSWRQRLASGLLEEM